MPDRNLLDGILLYEAGKTLAAREIFVELTKTDPGNGSVWLWLATCTEDIEQKREYLKRALTINPNNRNAQLALIELDPSLKPNSRPESPPQLTPAPTPPTTIANSPDVSDRIPRTPESLLQDLHSPESRTRQQAARDLARVAESNERIVRALASIRENDPDYNVAEVAAFALITPVHQAIVRQHDDLAKQYAQGVDRPGCVTAYIALLILGAFVAAFLLWRVSSVYAVPGVPLEVGREILQDNIVPDAFVASRDTARRLGQAFLTMVMGILLTIVGWDSLLALGLLRMKLWARWLLIGAFSVSLVLYVVSFYFYLFATAFIPANAQLSPIRGIVISSMGLAVSLIFIWWFVQHKEWDNTL